MPAVTTGATLILPFIPRMVEGAGRAANHRSCLLVVCDDAPGGHFTGIGKMVGLGKGGSREVFTASS